MTHTITPDLLAAAAAIALEHWGIDGAPTRLPGENVNICIGDAVLKIATEPQADVDLEETLSAALSLAGLPVPVSMPSLAGDVCVHTDLGPARMLPLLPGAPWGELPDTPERLAAVGTLIAQAHQALVAVDHPHARRTHAWDLARAGQHRCAVGLIGSPTLRSAVDRALHLHAAVDLTSCPAGLLHGDVNDENVLFDGNMATGLLDLGDVLHGAFVQDIAIAIAYAIGHDETTLQHAASLVAAYDALRPLDLTEQQALFPLVMARLATSACIRAQRAADPDDATDGESLQSTSEALLGHIHMAPRDAELILCSTCTVHRGPGKDSESMRLRRASALCGALSLSYDEPLHIVAGRGQFLYAADGEPYLDLVNNVCHVGHCHEQVVRAIAEQAARLNTNTRYLHEHVLTLSQRLADTMPDPLSVCFFVNSGSEANELALRVAQAATGATDVLVIDGAYHGNTSNCIAMSPYKFQGPGGSGCANWVHVVPSPDTYRGEHNGNDAGDAYAVEVGRVAGEACAAGGSIAAFFAESLLSCGGQVPLPQGYLKAAFAHVRKAGGLCIADEVQVGFGRVGDAMWGFQLHDVVPDIVVLGKPMGNGHPIGAVVTTPAIAEAFGQSGMEFFSTFGGNPVSCAAANAVLDVIEQDGLQARAAQLGSHFKAGLTSLRHRHAIIGDVRGNGLFLGIELVRDRDAKVAAQTEATALVNAMRQRGVLLSMDGPLHNVIKIKPPMVLDEADIDMTLRLLDDELGVL